MTDLVSLLHSSFSGGCVDDGLEGHRRRGVERAAQSLFQ